MLPKYKSFINGHQAACLVVAFVLLAFVVSLMNPLFEATDEIRHYRYVRLLVTEQRLPVQGQEPERTQGHHPPLFYAIGALFSWWTPGGHDVAFQYPVNPFWGYHNWEVGVDNKLQYERASDDALILQWEYLSVWVVRWVNIAIGAAAVWLTYKLAKHLLPDRDLALGAAALLAFNPQFIYLSAAINNDILATLAAVAVLYMCIVIIQGGLSWKRTLFTGLLYSGALLSKLHLAVLGGVIALAVGFASMAKANWKERIQTFVLAMLGVVGLAVLVSGWWFVRNLLLYGDLTGMSQLNAMWGGRPAGDNWWAIRQSIPYLWSSLWGRFGYGQIPLPDVFPMLVFGIFILGSIGWLRVKKCDRQIPETFVLLSTVALFMAIVLYYILIQPAGAMGRFLFPAFPALAILVVKGWGSLVKPRRGTGYVLAGLIVIFALIALFGFLAPAVTYPASRNADVYSIQIGDVANINADLVTRGSASPGETLSISIDWQPLTQTDVPYAVFAHVVDEAGVLVAQRDTWPGLGRAVTTTWQRPFHDEIRIDLPDSVYAPNEIQVFIGMYVPSTGQRLPVTSENGAISDALLIGELTIPDWQGEYPNPLGTNYANKATLLGYDISPRVVKAGETLTLTVYWQSNEIDPVYRMFAQVLDSQWNVWGSNDGDTIAWNDGVITVTRQITLIPETPPGSYPLQVGLFNGGERLPVVAEDGRYLDDRVLLGPIRVNE